MSEYICSYDNNFYKTIYVSKGGSTIAKFCIGLFGKLNLVMAYGGEPLDKIKESAIEFKKKLKKNHLL